MFQYLSVSLSSTALVSGPNPDRSMLLDDNVKPQIRWILSHGKNVSVHQARRFRCTEIDHHDREDLSRTFKTPLISASTSSTVGVVTERRSPPGWGAPAGTRATRALTLTWTFGLTEAKSTTRNWTHRRQCVDPRLSCLELWDCCVNLCQQSTDQHLHGLDLWLQRIDSLITFSARFLQSVYCSHWIRHTV